MAITSSNKNAGKNSPARIDPLDMTKGMLVVLMVVYHSINYSSEYYLSFRYLGFLPPSFILITGFLISNIYSVRYDLCDWRLYRRLLVRGGKLLALFTLLNGAVYLMRGHNHDGQPMGIANFFDHWTEIYLSGTGRMAAFEVLLPISYLLFLAPLLIWTDHLHRFVLPALTLVVVSLCAVLDNRGDSSLNVDLMSAGVMGMLLGRLPTQSLNILGRYTPVTALAYCGYFALSFASTQTYLVQLLGACVALALIYGLCIRAGTEGWLQRRLLRLGRYSLLSYIVQIGILQLLSRLVGRPDPMSPGLFVLLLGALIFMVLVVECVEWLRARSSAAEECYKAVFA